MKLCPCDSQKRYLDCCGAYIQEKIPAETPEALMRSRYTAYVEENYDYIKQTMREPALSQFNKKEITKGKIQWLGLNVIASSIDNHDPTIGFVEFKARYQLVGEGIERCIHENSEFHRIKGCWYYVDGAHYG